MRKLSIKICGITQVADAILACDLGAAYLGLIFAPHSARCLNVDQAAEIANAVRGRCRIVGVFQDASAKQITTVKERVGIDVVQFHGSEAPELVASFRPNIRAVTDQGIASHKSVDLLLLDRPKDAMHANLPAAQVAPGIKLPYLFAGGLTPSNVRSIVSRLLADPNFAGVDVASGVEQSPGIKDKHLLAEFFAETKEAINHAIVR